jgi:hypothetical protein
MPKKLNLRDVISDGTWDLIYKAKQKYLSFTKQIYSDY